MITPPPTNPNLPQPPISPELVQWLSKFFTPVTHTPDTDIRQIDFRSGQFSVVEYLRKVSERQVSHGNA